jgi:hypothetical protein
MTAASQQLQHFQKQHSEREGRMLTKAALTMPQVREIISEDGQTLVTTCLQNSHNVID